MPKPTQCPAKDAICRKCNKRGHFQFVCRSAAKVAGLQTSPGQFSTTHEDAFLGAIHSIDDPWAVTATLEGHPVTLNIVQVFSGIVFYEHVAIGAVLFVLGGLGVVFMLMSIELMLLAISFFNRPFARKD